MKGKMKIVVAYGSWVTPSYGRIEMIRAPQKRRAWPWKLRALVGDKEVIGSICEVCGSHNEPTTGCTCCGGAVAEITAP